MKDKKVVSQFVDAAKGWTHVFLNCPPFFVRLAQDSDKPRAPIGRDRQGGLSTSGSGGRSKRYDRFLIVPTGRDSSE